MKSKFLVLTAILMVVFSGCGSSDKEEDDFTTIIGVHKFVVELSGSDQVKVTLGFQDVGSAKLYDATGDYKGTYYMVDDKLENLTKVTCSTDAKGENLLVLLSMTCVEDGATASYTVKAYINDKLVDEVKGKKDFSVSSPVEMIELFTKGK